MGINTDMLERLDGGDSRRLFLLGGILLILAGMLFGDIFAVFILHPNANSVIGNLADAASAVSANDPDSVLFSLGKMGEGLENRGTKVDAHVHSITLGYIAVILALIQPYILLTRDMKYRLAQLFIMSAGIMAPSIFLIHYVGLAYSPLDSIGWASIFADLSGFFLIMVCLLELIGLCRYIFRINPDGGVPDALSLPDLWESRALLYTGVLMLLTGFAYGMLHAGLFSEQYARLEISHLVNIVSDAAGGQVDAVSESIQGYGLLQGLRGTKIAAHAHMNEFGMLALMLAFVQPYIYLKPRWRRYWVLTLLSGAIILPVAVALEIQFGLVAGGLADVGGLLVFIALSGMFIGIVRHTGVCDAQQEREA